jgi:hypothetical protein
MSLEDLEKRIRVLEDIEAIKRLKARYCAYCDDSYNADGVAGLFTEDGVWETGVGRNEGREEIRAFFKQLPQSISFAIHMVLNPIIEVDGDTAKGSWYLLCPCTRAETGRAIWQAGRYDDEYVRVDGEWKFKNLKVSHYFFRTPFDEGWVKNRFV